jgi:hypothetical protein
VRKGEDIARREEASNPWDRKSCTRSDPDYAIAAIRGPFGHRVGAGSVRERGEALYWQDRLVGLGLAVGYDSLNWVVLSLHVMKSEGVYQHRDLRASGARCDTCFLSESAGTAGRRVPSTSGPPLHGT